MAMGADLLRSYVSLVPQLDESALTRDSQSAGQRAGHILSGQLEAGIREGMSSGARDTAQLERDGAAGGSRMGSRLGEGAKAGVSKLLTAATGGGIVTLFTQGMSQAMDRQQMTAKLQAQLGLTAAQSKTAGDVAGKLFSGGYGDGMEDINESIKTVMQNIDGMKGASSSTLQDVAGKALVVSKTFDQDLGGTTRAVSQMMRTGLAKNADEALDIITKGFQSGVDKSDDFLDTLNEYGTQFRKMGIDGATATGLLSQGLKAGARDGDLVADSIKEFSIRAVDGSKTTAQGFKDIGLNADQMSAKIAKGGPSAKEGLAQVLDGLRKIKDPAKQAQTAAALFGTQSEDMGKALLALHPESAAKGLGQVAGATDKANAALNATPQAKMQNFTRQLQGGLVNVLATKAIPAMETFKAQFAAGEGGAGQLRSALEKLQSAIGTVVSFVQAHPDLTKGLVAGAAGLYATKKSVDGIGSAFHSVRGTIDTARGGLSAFKDGLDAGAKAASGGQYDTLGKALKAAGSNALSAGKNAASAALSIARQGTASALAATKTGLMTAATKGWALAQRGLNLVLRMSPFGMIVTGLTLLVGGLVLAYNKVGWFRDLVDGAWRKIQGAFSGTLNWMTGVFWPGFMNVLHNVGGVVTSAKDTVVSGWRALTGAFSGAYNWVTGFFRKNWQTVLAIITGPIGLAVLAVAKNWDSIRHSFSAAKDWVTGFFKKAWSAVSGVLTDPVGSARRALDGLLGATGLRKPFTAVKDWVTGFFKREWAGLKKIFTDPVGAAKNMLDNLLGATGLRRPFTAVKDWVTGFFKREWAGLKKIFTDPVDAAKTAISSIFGSDDRRGLRGLFSSTVSAVGKIWDRLKELVKKPIQGALDIAVNPFIRGFNKLGGTFGLHFDEIKLAGGGEVPRRADGGTIPGPWYGPKADNVLGLSSAGVPTAWVNPGEFITSYASTTSMERKHPGTLEYINRYGDLPGHADGGFAGLADGGKAPPMGPSWQWQWEQVRKAFPQAILTSSYRPGATTHGSGNTQMSYHAIGRAIDVDGPGDTKTQVAQWLRANYANISHDLLYSGLWHNQGLYMGKWLNQPPTTVADHYNHVHWGLEQGSVLAGGAWKNIKSAGSNATSFVTDYFTAKLKAGAYKTIDSLAGRVGGGDFTKKLIGGMAKKLVDGILSWGDGKASEAGDVESGDGGTSKAAAAWRPQIEQALKLNGITPTEQAVQKWIRQIQSESGGNPNVRQHGYVDVNTGGNEAEGLVQVTPRTFKGYHVAGTSWNIHDPVANLAAGIHWAIASQGSGFPRIGIGTGYADGGLVTSGFANVLSGMLGAQPNVPVFDTGGTLAPGLNLVDNQTGSPELLVRPEQVHTAGHTVTVNCGAETDPDVIVDKLLHELEALDRRGPYGRL